MHSREIGQHSGKSVSKGLRACGMVPDMISAFFLALKAEKGLHTPQYRTFLQREVMRIIKHTTRFITKKKGGN